MNTLQLIVKMCDTTYMGRICKAVYTLVFRFSQTFLFGFTHPNAKLVENYFFLSISCPLSTVIDNLTTDYDTSIWGRSALLGRVLLGR